MNPRVWTFDLEANQPSGKIIQIGGCIGRIDTGEMIEEFNWYINPGEPISPYITELTGITQATIDVNGVSVNTAVAALEPLLQNRSCMRMPVVWGAGDLSALQKEITVPSSLKELHRTLDIKVIHQMRMLAQSKSIRGGLAKALEINGLTFEGSEHNAVADAINTFRLAHVYYKVLKQG